MRNDNRINFKKNELLANKVKKLEAENKKLENKMNNFKNKKKNSNNLPKINSKPEKSFNNARDARDFNSTNRMINSRMDTQSFDMKESESQSNFFDLIRVSDGIYI